MCSSVQNYSGNGLIINKIENNSNLVVSGNSCNVKISTNNGSLRIVGNNCRVEVENGKGSISYVGNNGRIEAGPGVVEKNISYTGNGGKITKRSVGRDVMDISDDVKEKRVSGVFEINQNKLCSGFSKKMTNKSLVVEVKQTRIKCLSINIINGNPVIRKSSSFGKNFFL